jgi:hypothetical protein
VDPGYKRRGSTHERKRSGGARSAPARAQRHRNKPVFIGDCEHERETVGATAGETVPLERWPLNEIFQPFVKST